MKLSVMIIFILSSFCLRGGTLLQPSPGARDAFANGLLRSLLQPELPQSVVLFSPASLQKLLVAFYNFSYPDHMRLLAQDLCLIEGHNFVPTQVAEVLTGPLPVRLRQVTADLITGYIAADIAQEYFAQDFAELGSDILLRNYFIYDGQHEIASSFHRSVWEYFNVEVLSRRQRGVGALLQQLGIGSPELQLYSGLQFHAHLDEQFRSVGKYSYSRGEYRYAERLRLGGKLVPCMCLELPLQTETSPSLLTLLLLMPAPKMSLEQLEAALLSAEQRSYQQLANQLIPTSVAVRLPNLQFYSKVTLQRFTKEMTWLFDAQLPYHGNPRRTRLKRLVQTIRLRIHAPGGSSTLAESAVNLLHFFYTNNTFDCATRPFLFVVRSKDVIYFMGRHRRISARAGAHFGRI
ncbi:uncharacterized protein DMAD_04118 [Drosophila madeirensis]|uniref:Serpin domain-containing protein n=2 Tax=Drosophila madeirensis TaxID=30013 RepID=A0AAU9GD82_DROMD